MSHFGETGPHLSFLPHVLPVGYTTDEVSEDGAKYVYRGMHGYHTVIVSAAVELDGREWLHVSVATPSKLPSWDLLKFVKEIFIGRNRQAIQVIPGEAKYVNIHPNCLHLFACLSESDPVPDFTRGGTTL